MNRKRIQMDYGHLSVDQLPHDVKRVVEQDDQLLTWFKENDWLQNVLALKRAEQPAPEAASRIQHRVETRLANASPQELAHAAREERGVVAFLFGQDSDGGNPRSTWSKLATPLTVAAGMAIGLYTVHLIYSQPDQSGNGFGATGEFTPISTAPHGGLPIEQTMPPSNRVQGVNQGIGIVPVRNPISE